MGNDIIIGGGQVGTTLSELFNISTIIDIKNQDVPKPKDVDIMHVCFPYSITFIHDVIRYFIRYSPKLVIIHSTVKPGTTDLISEFIESAVVYSPIRGVHSRFIQDIKKYTKFVSVSGMITPENSSMMKKFEQCLKDAEIKHKSWKNSKDLEFAKIMTDTTYYGWIIVYRYVTDIIAKNEGVDSEIIWQFAEEIQENLHNRPIMKTDDNGIGGHCILPNLDLMDGETFNALRDVILRINETRKSL